MPSNVITTHHRIKAAIPIVRLNDGSAATPALTFEDGAGMYNHQGNVVFTTQLQATGFVGDGSGLTGIKLPPSINTITITDSSWNPIDDLALSTSSTGYVTIGGNNFEVGTIVSVGGTAAASITVVNSQLLRVSVNPKPSGTYDVVVETGVGSVTKVNAVSFDPLPVWSTGSSLGNVFYEKAFSIPLSASDGASAITYSNTSALPPSTTLASNGMLQGNIVETSSTTYNFSVEAIDAQLQSALRSFSLSYVLFSASGGTITTSGGFTYHTFTSDDTLTVAGGEVTIEYAVIGAGGGGGSDHGGGGGAGQVLVGSAVFTDGSYIVTIGPGGLGAPKYGYGQDGGSTSLGPYSAIGGGGGAPYDGPNGRSGASGGGAGGLATGTGGAAQSVSTGYAGGSTVASNYSAAGGGGAGGVGSAPTGSGTSSAGGVGGLAVNVFGNFYGGGGGGASSTGAGGAGGGGGAGAGGTVHTTDGYDASPNTGSGGGGGGGNNNTDGRSGGQGGSGLVIVRYLS